MCKLYAILCKSFKFLYKLVIVLPKYPSFLFDNFHFFITILAEGNKISINPKLKLFNVSKSCFV
ncbi:Uncharacterized protein PRO82_001727 [Candidatus Protochlamydia amoebophila]|nr:Uncharacterized protein [Candidatus Protochlamydia amoebophila]